MWFKSNDKRTDKRIVGDDKERLAENYLLIKGFRLIERNFLCRGGEIDLIMQDQDYLVFIEVRYRKNTQFGGALASITPHKQKKLRRAAEFYLLKNFNNPPPCRFDAIGIESNDRLEWIKNAF
jgi:putative endonuclease